MEKMKNLLGPDDVVIVVDHGSRRNEFSLNLSKELMQSEA